MQIKKVTKKYSFFVVLTEDDRTVSVPDDFDNTDRIRIQEWVDAGNQIEEEQVAAPLAESTYNWQGLAIAFKLSELNQILTQLKDESTNPQISAIWRISDDLLQVTTIAIFSDSDRIAGMTRDIHDLFGKLKEGNVNVPQSAIDQIIQTLKDNGFESVADDLARSSVV